MRNRFATKLNDGDLDRCLEVI